MSGLHEEDSCYWPDKDDPLGQVHGHAKYRQLELDHIAMIFIAFRECGNRHQMIMLDKQMEGEHHQAWEKAKLSAELKFLQCYRDFSKKWEEETGIRP